MPQQTVVILGAGAIRAAGMRRAIARRPPLDTDFFQIARKSSPRLTERVELQLSRIVGSYASEVRRSLEDTTTLLYLKAIDSGRGSAPHLAFLRQLELIEGVLARSTNDLPTGPRSLLYRLLRRELFQLTDPANLTVITFNYDLTIERTLEELQAHSPLSVFSFPHCYRFAKDYHVSGIAGRPEFNAGVEADPGVGVLKLHGSLNWHSSHTSREPTSSALLNPNRSLTITNSRQVVQSLHWRPGGHRRVYLKPIIVPPVTGKRGLLHHSLPPVWSAAAQSLRVADRVLICGYSCPPLDFEARMLLGENLQPDTVRELTVIDPDAAVSSRFMALSGSERAAVYSSVESYLDLTAV